MLNSPKIIEEQVDSFYRLNVKNHLINISKQTKNKYQNSNTTNSIEKLQKHFETSKVALDELTQNITTVCNKALEEFEYKISKSSFNKTEQEIAIEKLRKMILNEGRVIIRNTISKIIKPQ